MSEQKKAIDMTPEELKQWLSSLTVPEDDDIPCYYFSASDPYLKHEPMSERSPARGDGPGQRGAEGVAGICPAGALISKSITRDRPRTP